MERTSPSNEPVSRNDTTGPLALVLGGAVLNTQYNDDPTQVPIVDMLRYAFSHGVTAIDTSPYYGPSEVIYGHALDALKQEFPRETYTVCTKVGRIQLDEFDYSRKHVRFSVLRSCQRLKTSYLDLVYLHDIEFMPLQDTLEALRELRALKDEGIIRKFGLSGYPIEYLRSVTAKCAHDEPEIGPLDAVLSYCNLNLQNVLLEQHYDSWKAESGLKAINNGSILSMSLLREQETKSFHPCSQELRQLAAQAAEYTKENGVDLADLATRFAIAKWLKKGHTVLGVSNLQELKDALKNYWIVHDNGGSLDAYDTKLVKHIQGAIFGKHLNETWSSGIRHDDM